LLVAIAAAGAVMALAPAAATAWAPASEATIHPGVQTRADGGQCTANFVFTHGGDILIGQSAHCSGTGGATETDGCDAGSRPIGTSVQIDGGSQPGTMVYNSWIAMQDAGETDSETCAYNDFALVRIDPADHDKVNPSVPAFGGPQGTGTASTGQQVYTYGNSSLRGGVTVLSPKNGVVVSRTSGGWSYSVYTVTPGIPGDSGSAFLNSRGAALGTLSTVAIAPLPASNGVADLGLQLDYARANGFSGISLANGTEPFQAKVLGLVD
jgi:hypothetical protein